MRASLWSGLFAVAVLAMSFVPARAQSPPPAAFRPQANIERTALLPTRPSDGRVLSTAVGISQSYTLDTSPFVQMILTLRDVKTGALQHYLLAPNTTINEMPMMCDAVQPVDGLQACKTFPAEIVPGKTVLAVLYWRGAFPDFPSYRSTDAIAIVPAH